MNSRKFAIPPKQTRRILSENERKYIAYQNELHLWLTPKFWQTHYMQIWGIVWLLGKLALGTFFLAMLIIMLAMLFGIR